MFKIGIIVLSLFAFESHAAMTGAWVRNANKIKQIVEKTAEMEACNEVSYKSISENYVVGVTEAGTLCGVYDLSFPTLRTLFTQSPVAEIRVTTPKLKDYKIFLNDEADEDTARSFVEEEAISLDRSWYSRLRFKNKRALRLNEDGVYDEFRMSDTVMFARQLRFTQREKNLLLSTLTVPGERASRELTNFVDNPRSIFENMHFQYDSVKKAYKVFLDLDFLPINGPVKLADHEIQYRVWLTRQVRGLVLSGLNRLLAPVSRTQTGRIARYVLNEAFNFIEMTYDYQAFKFERTLRLALEGNVESELDSADLRKSLYLLYLKDTNALINIVVSGVQNQSVNLDNLYTYGKTTALRSYEQRQSISDSSFSNLYFEMQCDLSAIGYYFVRCPDQGNIFSTISDTTLFFWSFGNPKILNIDRPWEVFLKRAATYLLAGAVEVNFLRFPDWIASQVSSALKGYSLSGVLDEAFVVGELQTKASLTREEQDILDNLMSKTLIPFLPRSVESLDSVVVKNKSILGVN